MKDVIQKVGECDIEWIIQELENKKVSAQFPLQGAFEEDYDGACGKTYDLRANESEYVVPLYDDMQYTYSLLSKYKMHRTRVMKMIKGTCYSYHIDLTPRIHIPLTSNERCMFIIDGKVYKLPADGSVYLVDTTLYHTALNANREQFIRTHIVGNVIPQ
jgi:hypothetical protein